MTHRVGLALYDGGVHGSVLDLPGCIAGACDIEGLAHTLGLAIAEYDAWLRCHGEASDDDARWVVAETLDTRDFAATGGEFCFAAEREPLARDELERGIARMAYARTDLLDAVAGLPDAILDWVPPASAFAQFDAWAPEARSIRGVFTHVLQLEVYYRNGLRDGAAAGVFEKPGTPEAERARTLEALRGLTDDDRGRVWLPIRPSRRVAEEWTARKVLRRIISHERVHAAEIEQRRTWLLLGVPRGDGG